MTREHKVIIYPNIEILKGNCVSLKRTDVDNPQIFDFSPEQAAHVFEKAGARWLFVINLDNVFDRDNESDEIVRRIIDSTGLSVLVGGGIRSLQVVDEWFDAGAEQVVLGTSAVHNQRFVEEACVKYPERIVVSIDAKDGKVLTHGWRKTTEIPALELAKRYERSGVAGIIYTDIDCYEDHPESSLSTTTMMGMEVECPVISSGTVRSLDDISNLTYLPNISGAIVGWALHNRIVSLQEAISIASQPVINPA
ncbi:MAG: 1-(5-phosphoribosyl)-5-[(5-phosphoribosylamino)methylideneamino] imidazole-4-carboxamide isomerase [Gammaproteobacteria bacterium]|nr:1-(5-phosphoribosyl)-5-[(5-phosphoribosylamino)methylideneamino] imidazole-4-carboxamide isomerase [Gammaproteobacteria bacterium]